MSALPSIRFCPSDGVIAPHAIFEVSYDPNVTRRITREMWDVLTLSAKGCGVFIPSRMCAMESEWVSIGWEEGHIRVGPLPSYPIALYNDIVSGSLDPELIRAVFATSSFLLLAVPDLIPGMMKNPEFALCCVEDPGLAVALSDFQERTKNR